MNETTIIVANWKVGSLALTQMKGALFSSFVTLKKSKKTESICPLFFVLFMKTNMGGRKGLTYQTHFFKLLTNN